MIEITASDKKVLTIGVQGENNARGVCFRETAEWKRKYPHGTISLWHRRPGEQTQYPCVLEFKAYGAAVWKITSADTQIASTKTEFGTAELRCVSDDVVVKSSLYTTIIAPSLDGEQTEPPEPAQAWVDAVLQAVQRAEKAAAALQGSYIMPPWYKGVNLTEKFADEIAEYGSPWKWIQARIRAGNFDGLNTCDYIPFNFINAGVRYEAQIAGIDTYYGYGNTDVVGHHIDFITRATANWYFALNPYSYNNGTSESPHPWLACELYLLLNSKKGKVYGADGSAETVDYSTSGILSRLPVDLQDCIVEKQLKLESRYREGYNLTNDNGWAWTSIGKLWVPTEFEVYGAKAANDSYESSGGLVQYPIFVGNCNRAKLNTQGKRSTWWLLNPAGNSFEHWCCVSGFGNGDKTKTSNTSEFPICFRIA